MIKRLFIIFILLSVFFLLPKKAEAQYNCTSAVATPLEIKNNESVTIQATSDIPVDNFFYEVRNADYIDPVTGFGTVVCVPIAQGGMPNSPNASACLAGSGTYPLVFKDPATNYRTSSSITISASQLYVPDYGRFPPYGVSLHELHIVVYVSQGNGAWSPVNSLCKVNVKQYRPAVCLNLTPKTGVLNSTNQLTIGLEGNPPAGTTITDFQLSFFNLDNMLPGFPKSIKSGGTDLFIKEAASPLGSNIHYFQLTLPQVDVADENWGNQYPVNIRAVGYFYLDDTGYSAPDPNCTIDITLQRGPLPTATPLPPGAPTATPTLPPPAWHSPDGQICNFTNYITYWTDTSCKNNKSHAVNISPNGQCSTDGTGKCFRVGGNPVNRQIASYWRFDNQACTAVTVPYSPTETYDTLYDCYFGRPPISSVNGTVTLNFASKNQFDSVYIWLNDVRNKFLRNIEIPKNTIQSGQPFNYQFTNLFPDRKYDVYVLAYASGGIVLENVDYIGSCQSPVCRVTPPATINITADFHTPAGASVVNQASNKIFQDQIDKWRKGLIGPLEMSQFINQLPRVPGLQKAICDPLVPNGCRFQP